MNCEKWHMEISGYIDNELNDEESQALFEHLASCPDCRAFLADARVIHRAFLEEKAAIEKTDGTALADYQPLPRRRVNVSFASVALTTFLACLCSLMIGMFLARSQIFVPTPIVPSDVQISTEQVQSAQEPNR